MTPADLERLVRQGSQSADELRYTPTALDIDEAALRSAEPALLRDMERICSFCTHKRLSRQEVAAGTAAANYAEYRENSDTIDMLSSRAEDHEPISRVGRCAISWRVRHQNLFKIAICSAAIYWSASIRWKWTVLELSSRGSRHA